VRFAGAHRKENVGISNDNAGEKPAHRINIPVPAGAKSDGEQKILRTDGNVR